MTSIVGAYMSLSLPRRLSCLACTALTAFLRPACKSEAEYKLVNGQSSAGIAPGLFCRPRSAASVQILVLLQV